MSSIFLILIGFTGLLVGGEILVRGAVRLAQAARLSPMVIGVTLVGFGTSMPELVTSLQAALSGADGIAIGNVIGSNTANILLILGVAALIRPFPRSQSPFLRDGIMLALATALCTAIVLHGTLSRLNGLLLLIGLAVYLWQSFAQESAGPERPAEEGSHRRLPSLGLFAAGLALTILGARFLVEGAVELASAAGVSDAVIGLTVVAVGTSLPELVTSVIAAMRGRSDIALGNIIGSNIFNILGILGITALVSPLNVPAEIAGFDIWVMLLASLALLAVMAAQGRLPRPMGGVLLIGYALYVPLLF